MEDRYYLGNLDVDGWIILKWTSKNIFGLDSSGSG
jgi:hypothetical protein